MKLLYFFLTSSFMIGLVLLIRKLFRKKLSANVIYALWLLPFIRLLLPVGFLEVPVFGNTADLINRPVVVVEELFKEPAQITPDIYKESLAASEANKENSDSVKIYDAVIPKENFTVQIPERDISLNNHIADETTDNQFFTNHIILTIWCAGSVVLGCYVFVQNRKLRRKIDQLVPVDQIDGIDICISKVIKTPCLIGVHNPKIVLTGEVYVSPEIYKYAILHEMAHYHNKDHFWNMARIFLCILYWWHPLVWYAAKCVAEDAELACDERVLKGKNVEERKKYGYALLKMIENAQNKPLCLATSFSGSKKSMKQRIEAISHKRTTRKYILFPALLVLAALLIAGCVYPSNKSYLKTSAWENGDNGEWIYNEAEYPYSIQDNFKSYVIYTEIYEYGELVKTEVLGASEIEDFTGSIKMRNDVSKSEEKSKFILEIDDFGIEMQSLLSNYLSEGGYAHSSLHSDKQVEIKPEESLILKADFRSDNNTTQTYNCLELSRYTEDELKEQFKDNYAVGLYRIVFSELPSNELYRKYSREEIMSLDEYNQKYAVHHENISSDKTIISNIDDRLYLAPEEGKVCLAVMPDGISKSGGDYRYIIPEDQIKWIDSYKQARSLAVEGAWKDGECSAGIWLVFNDEWTCITDQGMIFDFDKHVEKENIEEFYNLCVEEAKKYGTGTPVSPEDFPEIISATLNYNGVYTVTDVNVLKDLRKMIYTSKEIRGGSSCPFTAALVLELTDNVYETIYLATDSCSAWLTDGVYYEYYGYNGIEEISDIFERNGVKINAEDTILKIENNQEYVSLTGNTTSATKIIKQAEDRAREGYKEAKLTYVDNAEVGWNFYNDNPWASAAERDALAQAALKELYTLTGYNVEACTYTTNGRSKFIFGKSAENIKKSIAFYSRDYGFTLYGDEIPFMGFVNARRVHYSDVQQLDSPYHKKEFQGNGAIPAWFLEHSGVYQGEKIIGFDAINLDDTVYTHIKLMFDGGYYIVLMDEKIESFHSAEGPFFE